MSMHAIAVTTRLDWARRRWWTSSLAAGLALTVAASLAALLACALVDAVLNLPQRGLMLLFAFWAAFSAGLVAAFVARMVRCRRGLEATARRVELEFPELESHLINLIQFSRAPTNGQASDPFRLAAVSQAAVAVAEVPFERAGAHQDRRARFALGLQSPRDVAEASALLAGVGLAGLLLATLVPTFSSATHRLLNPLKFIPTSGAVKIVKVTPGDAEVLLGAGLEIAAEIANPHQTPYNATLYVRPQAGGPETAVKMLPDAAHGAFVAALPQVVGQLEYRLQVGDSQTRRFAVSVYERPTVTAVEATFNYPAYLALPPETRRQNHADLEAPQYTNATLKIIPSSPIASGFLEIDGKRVEGRVADAGRALLAELPLHDSSAYTIHFVNPHGHTDPEPRVNRIKVIPDAPPTVQIAEPARETTVAAGSKIAVVIRAADDHGLGLVRLVSKTEGASTGGNTDEPVVLASWERFAEPASAVVFHQLVLDPAKVKPGQTILLRALARDRRTLTLPGATLAPQEAATPWQTIKVIAPESKAEADLARLDSLREAVARILADQLRNRIATVELPRLPTRDEALKRARDVLQGQIGVQKTCAALVASIGATKDEETLTVKRVLNKLAFGEMLEAVKHAEVLGVLSAMADLSKPTDTLSATQERIIDVLQRLLNDVRRETAELLAELKKKADNQLPTDVKDKLRALKDKLDDFLKQQKKIVEASENLAKKPVDDFTEKDKQLLKDLAASEDDWSRFMADTHSDLSKLPEQDFSNPSLLKELVAVENELKMAKDALTKKTADIAVPLEQLGAEMAKEMTTNIEKWLPDTPDREKWSQEEPLTDDMKEAPLAELPKELEDIVGELMEGEEDLFDEMEDASSSWADSLDKGAGWDAMDGPISNNSARGVTGNRLPNTSEISGRSGEGRSGKSTGEFVSDTAVGKGGRKTPTRLTADAFVKGQVKDTSKDPTGGATGGGKESGAGGEGLRGPIPDRPRRQMERLATKQASLRNKAEAVDLKFQVMKFHHTDLKSMINQMSAVERDLRAGLYRNALRRREVVLQSLGEVKMYVKGESTVRQDRTANLPTEIQKDILGSMNEPSPAGWETLNRQYFERLSNGKASSK